MKARKPPSRFVLFLTAVVMVSAVATTAEATYNDNKTQTATLLDERRELLRRVVKKGRLRRDVDREDRELQPFPVCYVCQTAEAELENPDTYVVLPGDTSGVPISCADVEQSGLDGNIDPNDCDEVTQFIFEFCECTGELPTFAPTVAPSAEPSTTAPSGEPTLRPSDTVPSSSPTDLPSTNPSTSPTDLPSSNPSSMPSTSPSTVPSSIPSLSPSESLKPSSSTDFPSLVPSFSIMPSLSLEPSETPSTMPSSTPSLRPTQTPTTGTPTQTPTTAAPSAEESDQLPDVSSPQGAVVSVNTPTPTTMSPSSSTVPSNIPSLSPSISAVPTTDIPSITPTTAVPSTSSPNNDFEAPPADLLEQTTSTNALSEPSASS
eukprot:CAMPEP_0113478702 /NCGR_PEP_ID=MMETSP0014_2-20120614/20900_1 /TAXON_ID=2857 /ORGANISM="Nitzschia sp." /LENGTH=375 /DNA_ID=CAMNT_0000371917 /DNA_START=200 /DNA_END=1324 /DNA_ORIENTATION=+ /assembly_acc=CAM_ASM_000159